MRRFFVFSLALLIGAGAWGQNTDVPQADIDARRDASVNSTDPHRTVKEGGKAMNQKKKGDRNVDQGYAFPESRDAGMEAKGSAHNMPEGREGVKKH